MQIIYESYVEKSCIRSTIDLLCSIESLHDFCSLFLLIFFFKLILIAIIIEEHYCLIVVQV